MNNTALRLENVVRSYDGNPVLKQLNLNVPQGSIYGLLGRNGSGKTTAIKLLAGLIRPDSGTVSVSGGNPWDFDSTELQNLGYQSESQILPANMRVEKLIRFLSKFYPIWDSSLSDGLIQRFGLSRRKRIRELSLGQQRLVSLILAVAHHPAILILDEPAANLDTAVRRDFLDLILEFIREGKTTVLFSTHILSDVERVADHVGILNDGHLRVEEDLDTLKESIRQVRLFDFTGPVPTTLPGALNFRSFGSEILAVVQDISTEDLARTYSCRTEDQHLPLEEVFIELTRTHPTL